MHRYRIYTYKVYILHIDIVYIVRYTYIDTENIDVMTFRTYLLLYIWSEMLSPYQDSFYYLILIG